MFVRTWVRALNVRACDEDAVRDDNKKACRRRHLSSEFQKKWNFALVQLLPPNVLSFFSPRDNHSNANTGNVFSFFSLKKKIKPLSYLRYCVPACIE